MTENGRPAEVIFRADRTDPNAQADRKAALAVGDWYVAGVGS